MIWIGIAIGIIFTSCFGMVLLVIVSKQKSEIIPKQLADFWKESLMNQRNQFHAIASIADAIEEHNGAKTKLAWMIERTSNLWGTEWFCAGENRWTKDANKAIHFPNKPSGEEMLFLTRPDLKGKPLPITELNASDEWEYHLSVTEHKWL